MDSPQYGLILSTATEGSEQQAPDGEPGQHSERRTGIQSRGCYDKFDTGIRIRGDTTKFTELLQLEDSDASHILAER